MLSEGTRKEYYEKVKYALHPYAKYIHSLLDALENDHIEAVKGMVPKHRDSDSKDRHSE